MSRILLLAFDSPPGALVITSADTATSTVTIVFTSVNAAEYSLDGGSWTPATSPLVLGPLTSAAHTLALRDVTDHTIGATIIWSPGSTTVVSPALGNETTAEAIRDRIIAVIGGLTPKTIATDRFIAFRNERDGAFQAWAEANPTGCRRRFQVRQLRDRRAPDISNTDFEERMVTFRILVAYPQSHRDGPGAALDRDDALDSDMMQIEHAIGMCGRANLAPPYPDACWRLEGNGEPSRIAETIEGAGVDIGVMYASYTYRRAMT
jgi:hypothetical protein